MNKTKTIGIIGSREMSSYGREVVEKLVPEIIKNGFKIVTGSTMGINWWVKKIGKENVEVVKDSNMERMNIIIAEKSDKLIVVEGGENSGTILVAMRMLELGKEVWAVPGRITDRNSMATNFLIKNGAMVLTEASDII